MGRMAINFKCIWCVSQSTYHFLPWPQDPQLAESDVEGGAQEGAIGLADHHHVYAARQGGLVDALVQLFDSDQHLPCQLTHVVHGVSLPNNIEKHEHIKYYTHEQ